MFYSFEVITLGTVISVVVAGLGMALYLVLTNRDRDPHSEPSLISLLVIGWSYLIALGADQWVEGNISPQRFAERLVLWALFAFHASVGRKMWTSVLNYIRCKRYHPERCVHPEKEEDQ